MMAWEDMGYGALPDPEVERDRKLQRRPREARHTDAAVSERLASWQPRIVAMAKCQSHVAGCPETVAVTAEGMDALLTFSAKLEREGEAPLDINACFPCPSCYGIRAQEAAKRTTARRERVAEAVRYLKAADDRPVDEALIYAKAGRLPEWGVPDAEKAAFERLAFLAKVMGIGYVQELITAIREKRKAPGRGKPRAGDL